MPNLACGKRHQSYVVTRVTEISEIQNTLIELEHLPTGAQIMHLANDDDENLFNLSFRTWPQKSNGVAHILEHAVLCGSDKFPIHDPFFAMSRRSLNTFMNALTGPDFTCYPASSQVPKDFYNLLEVYLDAVFKPKLLELSFFQEGWRLEFLKGDDPNSPLLFKGVVFNEMKGAMAVGPVRLAEALMHALFPDLTYGVNSGGDPKEIPNLTYEELKAFHAQFYHPSRCLFFFYGNLPLEKHLDFLETHAFKGIQKLSPISPLPKQPRFKNRVYQTLEYPVIDEAMLEGSLVGMAWLTCSILEQEELLALNVLDVALMGTDAAPLKKALLRSNLCKQADSLIDNEMSEIPYSIICKGCKTQSGRALEKVIRSTLAKIVQEGLAKHLIEGAIHQFEMARTEITGNSAPFGLSLFFRSALLKQHGGNPEDGLRVHTLFHQLREKVKDSTYLPHLIEKHLLNNSHFIQVVMDPDKELAEEEMAEEQNKLQEICQSFKDEDVFNLITQAKNLSHYQEGAKDEDLDILPTVNLDDVEKEGKEFPIHRELDGPLELSYHPCFTNEFLYADLVFDLPTIEEADLSLFQLFIVLLPQMGCGQRTYQEHLEYLLEHTGGVDVSLDLGLQAENPQEMRPTLSVRGKALERKQDKLLPIFKDLLTTADFTDVTRLEELLKQHVRALEDSIQYSSMRYAVNLAARKFSVPSKIINAWHGLDYFWAIKEIFTTFEKNPTPLIDTFKMFQERYLGLKGGHLVLSTDEKNYEQIKRDNLYGLQEGLQEMPRQSPWKEDYSVSDTPSQGRMIASPVAFTALLFTTCPYVHPDAPALSIAAQIMGNKILHKRIREQGGAYGGGAVNGVLSGQFYFYAYRDPHLASTVAAFQEASQALVKGNFENSDLNEAKLGVFQALDSPVSPGARAAIAFFRLWGGRTHDKRQQFRSSLLSLQKEDIQAVAENYLLPGLEKGVLVSFAGKELLEKENNLLKEPLPLHSYLT